MYKSLEDLVRSTEQRDRTIVGSSTGFEGFGISTTSAFSSTSGFRDRWRKQEEREQRSQHFKPAQVWIISSGQIESVLWDFLGLQN